MTYSNHRLRVRRSSQTIFSENACLWYTGWLKIKYPTRQYAISLNQWSDFKNSWNCLILTLLWIQQCTVYPLHLNYTTTLTCKIITMKITIFTGEFFGNTQIICLVTPENYEIISETLILLIFMFAELCLNATRHFNPAKYHRRTEESLAINMGWSATELRQQGHTELCQKTSSLRKSWGGHFERVFNINSFRRVLNCYQAVTVWSVKFPCFIWFQYKHCDENCNFHSNCFTR